MSDQERRAKSKPITADTEELQALRQDSADIDRALKKNMMGYSKASVEEYVDRLKINAEQMQMNLENQIRNLSAESSRLTSEGDVLRKQLVMADMEKSKIRAELGAVKNELEQSKRLVKSFSDRVDAVTEENEYLKETLKKQASGAAYEDIEKKMSELDEDRRKNLAEIRKLKAEVAALTEEKARLSEEKADVEKLEAEKKELAEKYEKLKTEHHEMKCSRQNMSSESAAVTDMLEIYQAKEREYALLRVKDEQRQKILEENKVTINMLLEEMEKQLGIFETLSEDHRNDKETICHLSRENANLESENMELQDKLQVLTRQYAQLENESIKVSRQLLNQKSVTDYTSIKEYPRISDDKENEAQFSEVVQKAREITKVYSMNGIKSLA